MDRKLFKSYEKELMKMEMLKHERIFREQVNELHRLYRVQKLLMSKMETSTLRRAARQDDQEIRWTSRRQRDDDDEEEQILDESKIELTLGQSVYKISSSSSSSQNQHQIQKRPSSGQSSNYQTKREDFGWSFAPSTKNGREVSVGEEHLRQDRMEKHPHWLFQPLTLKLT